MPDRVKGAVFSMLGARFGRPGALPALSVADVFAGSGSMGLEALSRGAAKCCFFERGRAALDALRDNLTRLQVGSSGYVVTRDAWRHGVRDAAGEPFDLVFLDPPYVDSADTTSQGAVPQYLARLGEVDGKRPLVVLHHRAGGEQAFDSIDRWRVVERRTFGTGEIAFLER